MTDPALDYIDYEQMEDGSRRWLWAVIYQGRLWRAGVEHQYDHARERATRSWDALRRAIGQAGADQLRTAAEMADDAQAGGGGSPPPDRSTLIV